MRALRAGLSVAVAGAWPLAGGVFGVLLAASTSVTPLAAQPARDLALAYAALDLEPLQEKVATGFHGRELRLRTSVSYAVPHALLVVREGEAGWEGGVWLWSAGLQFSDPRAPRVKASCDGVDWSEAVACAARPPAHVAWGAVAALALDTLGAGSLPSPQELPLPERGVIDGLYLWVEVAEGGRYRAFSWTGHEVREEPEARRALALHRLVDVLTRTGCEAPLEDPWPVRLGRMVPGAGACP